ncbi:MAG: hypothetical protein N4A45_09505 [Flavobacteriales bacterium]|nr:hypothetical protein [Flavobacteriales bacterium]
MKYIEIKPRESIINFKFELMKLEMKNIFDKALLVRESANYVSFDAYDENYSVDIDKRGGIDCFFVNSDSYPRKEIEKVMKLYEKELKVEFEEYEKV